jgi:hypothetical protein
MKNDGWTLIDKIVEGLSGAADLPDGLMFAVAERLDESLNAPSRKSLGALASQLEGLYDKLNATVPDEVNAALLGDYDRNGPVAAAFSLGQISFAQLLAAQGFERRTCDEFVTWVNDHRFKGYVQALAGGRLTCLELAHVRSERIETVSRKLKLMRELGISDFRKEGTRIYNFLTPAARSIASEFIKDEGLTIQKESPLQSLVVTRLQQKTSDFMQKSTSFARMN